MSDLMSISRRQKLHNAVKIAAPDDPSKQLLMLRVCANRIGASEKDVDAVREQLVKLIKPVERECQG